MHIKAVFASTLIFYSYSFGMEQTNKYDAWKRISLSKRWRNSNCAGGAEMGKLSKRLPPLREEIKFHHGTTLEIEGEQSVTWLVGNTTIVEWPRQQSGISIASFFFYPVLFLAGQKLIWENKSPCNKIVYTLADESTNIFPPEEDERWKKRYGVKQKVTGKRGNYRAFSIICNRNEVVCDTILKEDEQCAFGKIDTCNVGFLTGVQYEFETKTSYLFWMDPLVPSNYPHLRVPLSGELTPKDFDRIYLSYAPDGTYCTFIYENQSNTPICLVWGPQSRGTFFDEHFAKLENAHFNFK